MLQRLSQFKLKKQELIFIGLIMLVYFIQRLFMYKLGIYMEECRDADAHLMVLQGKVPYRDFQFWVYGPFVFLFYPLIFKIFGVSLAVFRFSYVVIGALVIPLIYCLSRRLMPPIWAMAAAFLSIVLIDVPYYTYNHIFATVFGLLALLFIVKFVEEYVNYYLLLSGIFIGMTMLVKPYAMGLGALCSIILFLMVLKFHKNSIRKISWNHLIIILAGSVAALAPCLFYFIAHDSLYDFLTNIIPLGPNRAGSFYVYHSGFSLNLRQHLRYLSAILPYRILFSPKQWQGILVQSYYSLLLYFPVICPLAVFLFNKFVLRKYNLISKSDLTYFLLFAIFSIFISAQSLLVFGLLGRSFTMQIPFLLAVYFIFLLNRKKPYAQSRGRRHIIAVLSVCFIFYLSFLHFFRYPYSRNKLYVAPLELKRAKGIRVTVQEKMLYESLNKFFSENTQPNEPIAVMGYYPQIAFLINREDIFADIKDGFIKFFVLSEITQSDLDIQKNSKQLEDTLINRLELAKPKFIISPLIDTRPYLTARLIDYINKNYALEQTLGPADIDIYTSGIVRIYRIKYLRK